MASQNTKVVLEHIDFSKVDPKTSIIVIKCERDKIDEIAPQIADSTFVPQLAHGTAVLFLQPEESLELVDEKTMNATGWYRL